MALDLNIHMIYMYLTEYLIPEKTMEQYKVRKEIKAIQESRDLRGLKDRKERRAILEILDLKVRKEFKDQKEIRAILEKMDNLHL